jgi:flagellar assembly protein FliH
VIKAYSIRYEEEKKVIDTNTLSEEHIKKFLDSIIGRTEVTDEIACAKEGFVEGLSAIKVEAISEEDKPSEEDLIRQSEEQMIENNRRLMEQSQQIIEQAKSEVAHMMNQAKLDAEKMKIEIMQTAKQEGYEEGLKEALAEQQIKTSELNAEKNRLNEEFEQKVRDLEPSFIDLFLTFMKHFTGVLLEDKKEIIGHLIEREFLTIENSNSYLIRVSHDDFETVHSKKDEILWKLKENTELEIVEDRLLNNGQCLIETDSRVIDCSLDVQLKNLMNDMKFLAGKCE